MRAGEGKSAAEALLARGGVVVNDDGSTTHHQEERLSSSHHRDENNGIIDRLLLLANNEQPSAAAATPVMPLPPGGEKVDPLVRQAESKGIALLRMPCGMQRRQSNTTRFQKKTGVISWKIELCFHVPKSMLVDERGGGGLVVAEIPQGRERVIRIFDLIRRAGEAFGYPSPQYRNAIAPAMVCECAQGFAGAAHEAFAVLVRVSEIFQARSERSVVGVTEGEDNYRIPHNRCGCG